LAIKGGTRGRTGSHSQETEADPGAITGIRSHILEAAERVIHDRGVAAATTRAIAEEARCAEGSIYHYFPHKQALFIECIKTRYPQFIELTSSLPDRVGQATVRGNLEELAVSAMSFYRAILPIVAGTVRERELLEAQRRHFQESNGGPMRTVGSLTTYLRGEQRLGRVSNRVSARHAARLLLGACFGQVFLEETVGQDAKLGTDEQFVKESVRSILEGLQPSC